LFISYIHEEEHLAKVLKEWIESTLEGFCDVFVSGDTKNVPAGSRWLEVIDESLRQCTVLLVICSPLSIERAWVNFEAGCAWVRKIPVIPICHSGITKSSLPNPLSSFQGLNLEENEFPTQLFEALKEHLNLRMLPHIDHQKMVAEVEEARRICTSKVPVKQDFDQKRLAASILNNIVSNLQDSKPRFFYDLKDFARRLYSELYSSDETRGLSRKQLMDYESKFGKWEETGNLISSWWTEGIAGLQGVRVLEMRKDGQYYINKDYLESFLALEFPLTEGVAEQLRALDAGKARSLPRR
jgi:hypothetical protein